MKYLSKEELEALHEQLVLNAKDLFYSTFELMEHEDKRHIALGLAELALEEIGKSFTCLAYYSKESSMEDWSLFWSDWKSHPIKAHRAFLYELFSPTRMELANKPSYFPSKRDKIHHEKEASFYVDFDFNVRKVMTPRQSVDKTEIAFRVTSVYGPLLAAAQVLDLIQGKSIAYKSAFSDYARYVMNNKIYQQDALEYLKKMEGIEEDYNNAISDMIHSFGGNK